MKINDFSFSTRLDTQKLKASSSQVESQDDQALLDACKEFESIFLYMMMKEMKKSLPEDGLIEKSSAVDTFEDMYMEEMSKEISKDENTLGLAKQMYAQFKTQQGVSL